MKILSLKIYTDTLKAYRDGVPRLLDILNEQAIEGSFFFGMGSEGTGSAVSKLFGEGKEIVASAPGIIRDAARRGQDCGIYGWNPMEWQSRLGKMRDTTIDADIKRAVEYFSRRTGCRPNGFAAPGFNINYISLRILDDVHFKYCSDTFGFYPFLPKMSWKTFSTPQIPSTIPPVELVLHKANESLARERLTELAESLPDGLSVLPMNSIVVTFDEIQSPFREFILRCVENDIKFINLNGIVGSLDVESLPACDVVMTKAFGLSREVAVQRPE
ncbi:MAG: polysaccharide deacetylase family protein [Synergistaceae bacterium]|jgi:peptidoglycan/xylan/chitin deacetylase (PgdA/CDA1 family)|nr:polysaccharide deacetylase family protein [Synergistaceae bacterium]